MDSLFFDFRNTDNTEETWEIYLTLVKLELRNQKCYEENCLEQPTMDFVGFFAGCVGGRFCNSLVLPMIDNHNFIYCHNLGHHSFIKLVVELPR